VLGAGRSGSRLKQQGGINVQDGNLQKIR
jgi:hypothetical protein